MKPKKHLLATFSVLLIAALLVACGSPAAAPTATPIPPTPTSIQPTATPVPPTPENPAATQTQAADPTATVKAWVGAINNGDLEAALALMTQDARFQGAFTEPVPNVLDCWRVQWQHPNSQLRTARTCGMLGPPGT